MDRTVAIGMSSRKSNSKEEGTTIAMGELRLWFQLAGKGITGVDRLEERCLTTRNHNVWSSDDDDQRLLFNLIGSAMEDWRERRPRTMEK